MKLLKVCFIIFSSCVYAKYLNQSWEESTKEFDEYYQNFLRNAKPSVQNETKSSLLGSCGGITTLHWNAHVGRGCDGQCARDAVSALKNMANVVNADIVGAVELDGAQLSGYVNTGQAVGEQNDATTIFVRSGFGTIVNHHGFMLIHGGARKGGEAAKIKLNRPIGGCSYICVAAFHIPHPGQSGSGGWENNSKKSVTQTCSGVDFNSCGIGIGDWNRDMNSAKGKMYAFGFGGNAVGGPYEGTCCEGSSPNIGGHGGASFDHTITNIPGASVNTIKVWGYPVAGTYVHNPVSMCIQSGGPSPPTPGKCTGSDQDPYSTGHYLACCSGLQKCLKKWDPNRSPYYKCETSCSDPSPTSCTGRDKDPWASGNYVECCSGLQKCLKRWEPNRDPYYKCEVSC